MKVIVSPVFLAICALTITSAIGLKGLSKQGFYTNHDGETHTARIAQYYGALKDGQIPPRFANSLYQYLGSPIFVYIYPLPYIITAAIHSVGPAYVSTFKITMALGFLFSAFAAFLWLKEVFQSEKAAFFGALFYTWVPYRFLIVYVRASLSELLAYTFVPLSFFCLTKLIKEKNLRWTALCAISLSAILLSQNLVALITFPVIAVYVLISSVLEKSPKYFILAAVSLAWSLALSSVSYLPSIFERKFVHFDDVISLQYTNHFVTLKQLIRSPWGYGFDLPGTINDQMSFQIGLVHLLILTLAIVLVLYPRVKNNKFIPGFIKNLIDLPDKKTYILNLFFLVAFFLAVFLMIETKTSIYVWKNIKPLGVIDLPWRFLGLTSLALSFVAAYVAKSTKPGIIFLFFVALVLVANRNHLRINQTRILDDNFFTNYTETATQYSEFTPKWRQSIRVPLYFDVANRVEITEGQAKISNVFSNSRKTVFDADVISHFSKVRINKFYFPKVEVKVDGQKQQPFENLTITDSKNLDLDTQQDTSGLMQVEIQRGKHTVSVEYKETNLRLIANYLSLMAFVSAVILIFKNVKV